MACHCFLVCLVVTCLVLLARVGVWGVIALRFLSLLPIRVRKKKIGMGNHGNHGMDYGYNWACYKWMESMDGNGIRYKRPTHIISIYRKREGEGARRKKGEKGK